jgi:hypothetical protein
MRTTPQSGMNIFELMFFVVNCAIGGFIARPAFHHWGWIGGVLGFVVGFAIIPTAFELPKWLRSRSRKKDIK